MENLTTPDAEEIQRAMVLRMEQLRPLVAEHARLEQAMAALQKALPNGDAPYGYRPNGQPYRRRPSARRT